MDGQERRIEIIKLFKENKEPLSGGRLAKKLGVSRQVIVQDIALLRAVDKNILSTNKGYILYEPITLETKKKRIIHVKHTQEQILDELNTIVDLGGKVWDVIVEHSIYGQISVDLIIRNRKDAEDFMNNVLENKTKPLNNLTDGVHYHTIEAENECILNEIEEKLLEKGYLIS